jgi:hypothetical protein
MARLTKIGIDKEWGDVTYSMKVTKDRFIHFTTTENALKIVKDEKLVPPRKGVSIYAVSLVWGNYRPGVQTTHIRNSGEQYGKGNVVGLVFRTSTMPKVGFPEEVRWSKAVQLRGVSLVSESQGAALIKKAPERPPDEDFRVIYQ